MNCTICSTIIKRVELLICSQCKNPFHFRCLNITAARFRCESATLKKSTKCESCVNETLQRQNYKQQSVDDLTMVDAEDSMSFLNTTTRSLPESTCYDNSTIMEYRDKINSLETELQSAHAEIAHLNGEIQNLKQLTKDTNMRLELVTKLAKQTATPTQAPHYSCTPITSHKTPISRRNKSKKSLVLSVSPHNGQKECTIENTPVTKETKGGNSVPYNSSGKEEAISTSCPPTHKQTHQLPGQEKPRKILILADQQGQHLQELLQDLVGQKYTVYCCSKPGAPLEEVLKSERQEVLTMTETDYVIVLGGTNDKNPYRLQYSLQCWIDMTTRTNVIIFEVPYNKNLNKKKLNYELKFICSQHKNVSYALKNYYRYGESQRVSNIGLTRLIQQEIQKIDYKVKISKPTRSESTNSMVDNCTQTENITKPVIYKPNEKNNTISTMNDKENIMDDESLNNNSQNNLFRV